MSVVDVDVDADDDTAQNWMATNLLFGGALTTAERKEERERETEQERLWHKVSEIEKVCVGLSFVSHKEKERERKEKQVNTITWKVERKELSGTRRSDRYVIVERDKTLYVKVNLLVYEIVWGNW